jgi:hypothetical protein
LAAGFLLYYGNQLMRKLREVGALSEDTAKTIQELGLSSREIRTLKRLVFARKVKETADQRYYLS